MRPSSLFMFFFVLPYIVNRSSAQNDTNGDCRLRQPSEIVFVLESSRSIVKTDYERMIDEIRALPDSIRMGEEASRMAVVTFSLHPTLQVGLTSDERLIRSLTYHRQHTPLPPLSAKYRGFRHTHDALREVKDGVLRSARYRAVKIVVLITVGEPTIASEGSRFAVENDFRPTEQAARELRDSGAHIYASYVGEMTSDIRAHLIRVTGGDSRRVFDSVDFAGLAAVLNKTVEVIECDLAEVAVAIGDVTAVSKSDAYGFGGGMLAVGIAIGILISAVIVGFGWAILQWKKRRAAAGNGPGQHGVDWQRSDGAVFNAQYAHYTEIEPQ